MPELSALPHQARAIMAPKTVLMVGNGGGKSFALKLAALQICTAYSGVKVALIAPKRDELNLTHVEGALGLKTLIPGKHEPNLIRVNGSEVHLVGTDKPHDLMRLQDTPIRIALIDDAHRIAPDLLDKIGRKVKAAKGRMILAAAGGGYSAWLTERLPLALLIETSAEDLPEEWRGDFLASTGRDPVQRAAFANDRAGYIETVIGGIVAPVVDGIRYTTLLRALELIDSEPFVLIPGHHGAGKDWLLGRVALHHHDSVAAQPDESGFEAGARTVLIGPTATSIFQTTYTSMIEAAAMAERRGYAMPGGKSAKQPYWSPREGWVTEGLSPQHSVGTGLAHSASGRHHRYLLWVLGEAGGIRSAAVQSAIGSASGEGNRIICIFNPDRSDSAVAKLMRGSTFRTISLSALDHVNIRTRRDIIPGAVSRGFVDGKVRECIRLGDYPETQPDPARNEFVYALPARDGIEGGAPRPDGFPGHVHGDLAVWRPTGLFEPQVLGVLPIQDETKLFREDAWDAAVERWRRSPDPEGPPDLVGIDCAREGDDDTIGAPRWGPDAYELLSRWAELTSAGNAEALAALIGATRVGVLKVLPKGDGPTVAAAAHRFWPQSPWNVDDGGQGVSMYDHAVRSLKVTAFPITYGAAAPARVEGQAYHADNVRAAMHFVAAAVVNRGFVNIPPDPLLREEAMAVWTIPRGEKSVEVKPGVKKMVTVRGLPPKRTRPGSNETSLFQILGRSPDRLDAFVEALWRGKRKGSWGWR